MVFKPYCAPLLYLDALNASTSAATCPWVLRMTVSSRWSASATEGCGGTWPRASKCGPAVQTGPEYTTWGGGDGGVWRDVAQGLKVWTGSTDGAGVHNLGRGKGVRCGAFMSLRSNSSTRARGG